MSDNAPPPAGGAAVPPADTDPPPLKPPPPTDNECCGQGCVPCILELHDEAMGRYREALAAWRLRHPGVSPEQYEEPR